MSKPRYQWWGYIRNVIRSYPELKREYESLHQQSVTASLSGMPGSREASRETENIAIRELPRIKQLEYDAVRRAIDTTRRMYNGNLRMRIIELVYWRRGNRMTVEGAAMSIGYSADRGKQIHGDFVRLVAKYRGFLEDGSDETET